MSTTTDKVFRSTEPAILQLGLSELDPRNLGDAPAVHIESALAKPPKHRARH